MDKFEIPKTFDPHLHPREIMLIGCGGTGGHLARGITRIIAHMQSIRMNVPSLTLIDPDTVEPRNVSRQLFSPAEIGMNKAEVIAQRLSCALGLAVEWIPEAFNAKRHLARDTYGLILIDAVDNHLARRELARVNHGVLIACGNHRSAGQVSIGNVQDREEVLRHLEDVEKRQYTLGNKHTLSYLPTAYAIFPELLEPETMPTIAQDDGASCADLVLQGEQDILINDAIATIAARYVQQLLFRQPIQSFLTYCNLEGMFSVRPVPITLENVQNYLQPS
jgi:PRTRC genetic system ThiF family protein